jgi:hypothetical protein
MSDARETLRIRIVGKRNGSAGGLWTKKKGLELRLQKRFLGTASSTIGADRRKPSVRSDTQLHVVEGHDKSRKYAVPSM